MIVADLCGISDTQDFCLLLSSAFKAWYSAAVYCLCFCRKRQLSRIYDNTLLKYMVNTCKLTPRYMVNSWQYCAEIYGEFMAMLLRYGEFMALLYYVVWRNLGKTLLRYTVSLWQHVLEQMIKCHYIKI